MKLETLKELGSFVNWKSEQDGSGRMTKIPYSPKDGLKVGVSSEYKERWSSFDAAEQALKSADYDGIGFVFTNVLGNLSICGIDIDDAQPECELAKGIISLFPNAYVERSPSGNGLHLVMIVSAPQIPTKTIDGKIKLDNKYYSKNPDNGVETYVAGLTSRYFTLSGNVLQDGEDVDQTDEFLRFLERYMLREEGHKTKSKPCTKTFGENLAITPQLATLADEDILRKARNAANGEKFRALFDMGDISGYDSASNADAALCAMLAFYCGGEAEAIDRLFRKSKLYRNKWERADYRASTIDKAVKLCSGKFYGINTNAPKFIQYDSKTQSERVIPTLLAKHLRENLKYIFVKDGGMGGVNRFVYTDGCYRQFDDEMFKGMIKSYISDYDETLIRMNEINEVFNNIATDLNFVSYEDINANENIINFQNGLLRLSDMVLLPHSPDVLSTIQIPCAWTGCPMPTPVFDSYLATLVNNDKSLGWLILEFIGVALSNVKGWRMKKALFMVGPGDTGKSQLKSLVEQLLGKGNYIGIDLGELEARFGSSNLYNKRLAGSSDMSFITVRELKVFKKAIGGDSLFAEFKSKNGFEFVYNGLMWFCMNRLPKFGGDDGQWVYDRIMPVKCLNVIPLAQQDRHIADKMYAEREGIVYKAVLALQKVIVNGYRYSEPVSITLERKAYQAENNSVIAFWNECVIQRTRTGDNCTTSQIYDAYKAWCRDNNHGYAKTAREFRTEVCTLLGAKKFEDITSRRSEGRIYKDHTLTNEAMMTYLSAYGFADIPPQALK